MGSINHSGRKIEIMNTLILSIKINRIVVLQQFSLDSITLITITMPITSSTKGRETEVSIISYALIPWIQTTKIQNLLVTIRDHIQMINKTTIWARCLTNTRMIQKCIGRFKSLWKWVSLPMISHQHQKKANKKIKLSVQPISMTRLISQLLMKRLVTKIVSISQTKICQS